MRLTDPLFTIPRIRYKAHLVLGALLGAVLNYGIVALYIYYMNYLVVGSDEISFLFFPFYIDLALCLILFVLKWRTLGVGFLLSYPVFFSVNIFVVRHCLSDRWGLLVICLVT
jgi:hypothetical protein